jgi:hypothetical protein
MYFQFTKEEMKMLFQAFEKLKRDMDIELSVKKKNNGKRKKDR